MLCWNDNLSYAVVFRLHIEGTSQSENALPSAHTCFCILKLPMSYKDELSLETKLLQSLANAEGFGFI